MSGPRSKLHIIDLSTPLKNQSNETLEPKSTYQAHEVKLPPLRVTVYKAICMVLAQSLTPLHERELTELVATAYPPLVESIKGKFNRQIHVTLIKRQRNGVCERVAPATWRFTGNSKVQRAA